jgi:hypothetical protein
MSKTIIAIIIIIIVAGLGYWFYQSTSVPRGITEPEAKNCEVDSDCVVFGQDGDCNCGCFNKDYQWKKEGDCFCAAPSSCKCVSGKCEGVFEEKKDEISVLLEDLKLETGIDFSEIQDVEFKWIVKVEPEITEETVTGKGFEVNRISSEQFDSIYSFFKDKGFEADPYNFADGTVSGLRGYKKDKAVCTVPGGLTGYKEAEGQWIPPETDKWDITVKCGKVSGLTESSLSIEEALAIAQESSDCSMVGILTDEINYNAVTKTWWIDLERMPEFEKDGCNPACVVSEETETAEVNWRCTGLIEP